MGIHDTGRIHYNCSQAARAPEHGPTHSRLHKNAAYKVDDVGGTRPRHKKKKQLKLLNNEMIRKNRHESAPALHRG